MGTASAKEACSLERTTSRLATHGRPKAAMVFLVRDGLVSAIYAVTDERKLAHVRVPGWLILDRRVAVSNLRNVS